MAFPVFAVGDPVAPLESLLNSISTAGDAGDAATLAAAGTAALGNVPYRTANLAALDAVSTATVGSLAYMSTPGTGIDPILWVAYAGSGATIDWRPLSKIIAATRANLDTFIAAVAAITDTTFQIGSEALVTGSGAGYIFTSTAGVYRPMDQTAAPTVAVSGTGVSVDLKTGLVTFAAATSPVIQFGSADWRWTDFRCDVAGSTTADLIFNFRSGLAGANLATGSYLYNLIEQTIIGSATRDSSGGDTSMKLGSLSTGRAMIEFRIYNSMLAQPKSIATEGGDSGGQIQSGYGRQASTTAYDTINLRASTGTLTGTVQMIHGGVV